jgi:predicted metal-dependent phosphoesterase TrpH
LISSNNQPGENVNQVDNLLGKADLHMHTTSSDGAAAVQELLDYVAEQRMLDVIAITDHDVLDSSLWAYERRDQYPFDIIPGVEVTSADGHVLALWVTQPIPRGLSLLETAAAVHEQGGVAILAHPFEVCVNVRAVWRYLWQPEVLINAGIDGLEVHNAGTPTPGNNWMARRTAQRLKLPMVANSDAHMLTSIGCGITRFQGRTAADLRSALVQGKTIAEGVSWPITDYLKILPGSTQRILRAFLATNTRSIHPTRS